MSNRSLSVYGLVFLCFLHFAVGCGPSGPATSEISGKVSYGGKPIEDGDITFQPDEGSKGFTSSGKILNGDYKLSGETGLVPGTYIVKINALRESKVVGGGPDMPPETVGMVRKEQYLPAKFNTKSTIEKLQVEEGKKVEKNYDLK